MLVFDTSRLDARHRRPAARLTRRAAGGAFVAKKLPDEFRIGVIGFGSSPSSSSSRPPTTAREGHDRRAAGHGRDRDGRRARARVQRSARTPIPDPRAARAGCRRRSSCSATARARAARTRSTSSRTPRSQDPGLHGRARHPERHARTPTRTGAVDPPVPPDLLTLQDIARDTGGQFFATADAPRLEPCTATSARASRRKQGEAAGHVGVRRRRARAAAGRRVRALLRRGGSRERLAAAAPASPRAPGRDHARPSARPTAPGPARPAGRPALARPRGDEADREPRPRRAPDAADRPGHRAGDDPPVPPGRRRPPHRLERDRAPAGAVRARARRRAGADHVARARRRPRR